MCCKMAGQLNQHQDQKQPDSGAMCLKVLTVIKISLKRVLLKGLKSRLYKIRKRLKNSSQCTMNKGRSFVHFHRISLSLFGTWSLQEDWSVVFF